jgi:SAM-dependent methyltransferase
VLDLACGAGHSSFLMRQLFPGLSVFSVDHDFVSLYLSKRFLSPQSVHLCLDAEAPSPFPDGYFDAVFCLDAFHYLRPKRAIVTELRRVATRDALWLFPHLHNALQPNITAGVPLPPEAYLRCFDGLAARLFDETQILQQLCTEHTLDLQVQPPASALEAAPTLVLVAGPSRLWSVHREFPARLCRDRARLTINPIYRQTVSGGELNLNLAWPNPVMKRECGSVEAVLPAACRLNTDALRRMLGEGDASDARTLGDLVGRFVLVPLPPDYRRGRDALYRIAAEPRGGRRLATVGSAASPTGSAASRACRPSSMGAGAA